MFVLLGQRGPGTPDFQGLWNMPCGYLDWNESATEGVYRELYEETGLDLEEYIKEAKRYLKINPIKQEDLEQPWFVNHFPDSNRQNVTLRFGVIIESDYLPDLTAENCEPGEVSDLKWVNVNDMKKYDCAFGHKQVLIDYLGRYNESL